MKKDLKAVSAIYRSLDPSSKAAAQAALHLISALFLSIYQAQTFKADGVHGRKED